MRARLIKLIQEAFGYCKKKTIEHIADYLLEHGVIVLPCNAGDTVYKLWYSTCHNGENYSYSYSCAGCDDECDIHLEITEFKVPNLRFILDKLMVEDNDIYYLTKEEAEEALKK